MPVPKRKTSKSRRDMRSSTKFIRPQSVTSCKQCNEPNLPHQVCTECGYYKGRKVLATKSERETSREQVRAAAAKRTARKGDHADHDHKEGDHEGHDHE